MKKYKLAYEKAIDCGYVQVFENHSKFFQALKHAAFILLRDASLVTTFEIWKRGNPIRTMFTKKEYLPPEPAFPCGDNNKNNTNKSTTSGF